MDKIGRLYENTINAGNSQMFYVNARAFVERQMNNTTEIIVQTRNKRNEQALELPGAD
ncbi:hypothetical protein J41TS12_50810 [Paenibacillus antibioticophila]|uniref:Uncharacterized protein n=1 Tax=Paenibacillus antibioticophila TaxID=1274374 RepID=A0A919Y1A7_9BACL|nr:hypothetical protein J41TS12_50810 [Paenibacillus antibioticophila]